MKEKITILQYICNETIFYFHNGPLTNKKKF